MINRKIGGLVTASALGLVISAQSNAAVDAAVTTAITDLSADVSTVGAALIGVAVVAMGLKWLKAMFF